MGSSRGELWARCKSWSPLSCFCAPDSGHTSLSKLRKVVRRACAKDVALLLWCQMKTAGYALGPAAHAPPLPTPHPHITQNYSSLGIFNAKSSPDLILRGPECRILIPKLPGSDRGVCGGGVFPWAHLMGELLCGTYSCCLVEAVREGSGPPLHTLVEPQKNLVS